MNLNWLKSIFIKEKKDDVFIPPETRIMVVTLANGDKEYYPQHKLNSTLETKNHRGTITK